jgi:hypothetical protein
MQEFLSLRAFAGSQEDLIAFLESSFREETRTLNERSAALIPASKSVETRIPLNSEAFQRIKHFIERKRKQDIDGYDYLTVDLLRKYSKSELKNAEVLLLKIRSHFEPSGEECGTIYETLCNHCNWGRQVSDLILDLRRVPQHKDISETIAWVEWVVSLNFVRAFTENKLTGVEFSPIFEFKDPTKQSKDWYQLRVTGKAGGLAETTRLGRDPFSPSQISWRCPLGHSLVTEFLSEIYLQRSTWDGSDIAVTETLFGQGRNLLRPSPLIIISQRTYRTLQEAGIKGFSVEVAHLV